MLKVLALVYLCVGQGADQYCKLDAVIEVPAHDCLDAKNFAEAELSDDAFISRKVYCVPSMWMVP